jgi:hypothetical protein
VEPLTLSLAYFLAFSTRRHGHLFHHGTGMGLGVAGLAAVGVVVLAAVVLVLWLYRRAKRR